VADAVGAQEVEGERAQPGEYPRPGPDAAVILAQDAVTDMVTAVLYAPVPAHEPAEGRRVEPDLAGVVGDLLAPLPQAGAGVPEPGPASDAGDGGDAAAPPAGREIGGRGREDLDPALLVATAAVAVDGEVLVDRRAPRAQGGDRLMQARLVGLDPGEQGVAGPRGPREGFFGSGAHRP
jgi:hypothetical protein